MLFGENSHWSIRGVALPSARVASVSKPVLVHMEISLTNQTQFHMKGCPSGPVLEQRKKYMAYYFFYLVYIVLHSL